MHDSPSPDRPRRTPTTDCDLVADRLAAGPDEAVLEAANRTAAPPARIDRSAWPKPWAQLRFFTFQPAIFPKMLAHVSPGIRAGDWVAVYDKAGQRCGAGLYNPKAKIPLRVVVHGREPIGEDYFERALDRAVALRRDLFQLDAVTEVYRVVNSDGDGLSGLMVDRYGDTLFCDVFSYGIHQRLPRLLAHLHRALGTKHHHVRVDAHYAAVERIQPLTELAPHAPRKLKVREHGVIYEVDFGTGHKTGFFCDQRDNRLRLSRLVRGCRVLDLCCYTGGFALAAKTLGEADEVTGVDLDEEAVALARRNANLNQARIRWVHADAFAYARQMQHNGERWDVVVVDPPKFVLTREPAGAHEGRRKYEDLNQLAAALVKPGGLLLTCSCSGLVGADEFESHVIKGVHRLDRRLQIFDRTGAGPDHPTFSNCPESRYLKALWARVL